MNITEIHREKKVHEENDCKKYYHGRQKVLKQNINRLKHKHEGKDNDNAAATNDHE